MPDLPKRMDNFARTRAVRDSTLGKREKATLVAFLTFADADGVAWPSVATLSRAAGYGRSATRASLRRLEKTAWLVLVGSRKGGRMSNRYRFQVPNPPDGGALNATPAGPQPDTPKRPTRQSVAPSPPRIGAEHTKEQNRELTTQHTADAAALLALGVGEEWLRHANATPERIAWLAREAKRKASPAGFAVAAIREPYAVPTVAADAGNTPEAKRASAIETFNGLSAPERAKWVAHARAKYRNLADRYSYPDDSAPIIGAIAKLMQAGDAPQPKRAMGID